MLSCTVKLIETMFKMKLSHIYTEDVLKVLKSLPSESVDCIVKVPNIILRNYGIVDKLWLEQSPEQYIKTAQKSIYCLLTCAEKRKYKVLLTA